MSQRKNELLQAALDYLLENGIARLSLRPLAATLKTSPRMLMFHFGSKEALLQDVLEEVNKRLQTSFSQLASTHSSVRRDVALLKRFWEWATNRSNVGYLRLLYELQIIAVQNPKEYGRYLKKMSHDWQAIVLQSLSDTMRGETLATLCIAVFDGLFLELMSTGDHARLTRALDQFITMTRRTKPGANTRVTFT